MFVTVRHRQTLLRRQSRGNGTLGRVVLEDLVVRMDPVNACLCREQEDDDSAGCNLA